MKVTQKKIDSNTVHLDAIATAQEVDNALHSAQVAFAQSMGMRPEQGKTVAEAAKEQMGISDLNSIVEPQAIAALVPMALDKKNIIPAYMPKPVTKSKLKAGNDFSFSLDVKLRPEYELTSYEPVSFTAPKYTFDDSIVDMRLNELANNYTSYEKVEDVDSDYVIKSGDSIKIALEASEDGKRIDGLSTEGRTYCTGQGYMPEGFDKEVIGMKVGETKEFSFEGPGFDDDFNEITQTVDAKVTVVELQHEVKPEITDEWLKKNMPMVGGLDALRSDIRRDIEGATRAQYDAFIRQLAAAEAAKRFEGKIDDEVYESARANMIDTIRHQLQQENKTWESFVEENGGEQQFSMMLMLQIREMLVQGFALDAIFRHENLTLSDDDIEAACLAMNPQIPPKTLREQMTKAGQGFALRETAERYKANNWLVEHADITYQDAPAQA